MIAAWFDPGLLTGACVYDFAADKLLLLDEFDYINTGLILDTQEAGSLLGKVGLYGRDIRVGWETYRIMKGPQTQAPYALEIIGELKYLCAKYGYSPLTPAEPKSRLVTTPDMLKRMGWYERCVAKKDALSAAQHMVSWMLRENILPDKYKDDVYFGLK